MRTVNSGARGAEAAQPGPSSPKYAPMENLVRTVRGTVDSPMTRAEVEAKCLDILQEHGEDPFPIRFSAASGNWRRSSQGRTHAPAVGMRDLGNVIFIILFGNE